MGRPGYAGADRPERGMPGGASGSCLPVWHHSAAHPGRDRAQGQLPGRKVCLRMVLGPASEGERIVQLIAAVDRNWAIGRDGDQLAYLTADLKRFKALTTAHTVILGRRTLATFPGGRPLPGRRNLVLSGKPDFRPQGAEVFSSLETLLAVPRRCVRHWRRQRLSGSAALVRPGLRDQDRRRFPRGGHLVPGPGRPGGLGGGGGGAAPGGGGPTLSLRDLSEDRKLIINRMTPRLHGRGVMRFFRGRTAGPAAVGPDPGPAVR